MRDANLPGAEPLSDEEIELLTGYLARIEGPGSMNVEELDGFFSALIAGPELVPPSEYLPFVLGSQDESDGDKPLPFEDLNDINVMLGLTMRHWNTIARTLNEGEVYLPLILEGEPDEPLPEGHRWARGFMRGVAMRRNAWVELITDEDEGGAILPIALLAGEVDPDWLTKPVDSEKHSEFLALMAAGFHRIYEYFEPHRRENAMLGEGAEAATVRREGAKIGRNEPCPCGSGKKFKRCCGKAGTDSPSVH